MITPETAYSEIERLVQKFITMPARERKALNEHATRQGFIMPMFRALGWDIDNTSEVNPEEKVSRGFVDFSFRIGGVPRYFLETKKLDEDLNKLQWVQQAIDYAWTKSVTWALLSDFEGLIVFNAEQKTDNPFQSRFLDFNVDTYLPKFEQLWWLSREQTLLGRLDTEADKFGRINKRLPVSQELFGDLKKWRQALFNDIKHYTMLSDGDVDNAVLHLLNRLIFIRTAEDRLVEQNRLQSLVRELKDRKQIRHLAAELSKLFRELDGIYNSELFAPHFSEGLDITPGTLEDVINELYAKNFVRYNFNALEADVLGTVYEQYLGAVVANKAEEEDPKKKQAALLAAGEGMTVQDRKQKRKSQGIYYTPSFVTKYIVQQTVGKVLEENGYHPSMPPHILDMACGSGSFLIEAFDVVDKFVMNMRHQTSEVSETSEVSDIFDRARQLEVLQNCIYGVDKDKQALEVARLNLLLRALHSREKLPLLKNFHWGDSLKPETWEMGFPDVMKDGGFDIIIGNPPYIRFENLPENERESFANSGLYKTAYQKFDIYVLFLERAMSLLKPGGRVGFIVPSAILNQNYAVPLRKLILENGCIEHIVDFSGFKVFQDATVETCILVIRKTSDEKARKENRIAVVPKGDFSDGVIGKQTIEINQEAFESMPQMKYRLDIAGSTMPLVKKIENQSVDFGELFYVSKGIVAYSEDGRKKSDFLHKKKAKKNFVPYLEGKDVQRYAIEFKGLYLDYQPSVMARPTFREFHESPKILVRAMAYGLLGTYDKEKYYIDQKLIGCVQYKFLGEQRQVRQPENYLSSNEYDDYYALGLINSNLLFYYYQKVLFGGLSILPEHVRQLPIRRIDFAKPAEKAAHDEIVALVEKMLTLQKERQGLDALHHPDELPAVERQIAYIDEEINQRVYRLYGLTEEEINIIENKT